MEHNAMEMLKALHSPEQLRFLSNLAHWIEGALLSIVAILMFIERMGIVKSAGFRLLWPAILLTAGIFLPLFMLTHHGLGMVHESFHIVTQDPQQFQHLMMALLLMAAGLTRVLLLKGILKNIFWDLVRPICFFTIGLMFLMHAQHGTADAVSWAVTVHKYLGAIIILSSLLQIAAITYFPQGKAAAIAGAVLLLSSGFFLLSYSEPQGAYTGATKTPTTHGH